jgi:hypothetical protein
VEIPIYSFEKHQRENRTTSLYSPHVLILEGILAFADPRIVEMLDVKARGYLHVVWHLQTDGVRFLWKLIWMFVLDEEVRAKPEVSVRKRTILSLMQNQLSYA